MFVNGTSRRLRAPLTIYLGEVRVVVSERSLSRSLTSRLIGLRENVRRLIHLGEALLLLSGVRGSRFPSITRISLKTVLHSKNRLGSRVCSCGSVEFSFSSYNQLIRQVGRRVTSILIDGLLGGTCIRSPTNSSIRIYIFSKNFSIDGPKRTTLSESEVFDHFCLPNNEGRNSAKLNLTLTCSIYRHGKLTLSCGFTNSHRVFSMGVAWFLGFPRCFDFFSRLYLAFTLQGLVGSGRCAIVGEVFALVALTFTSLSVTVTNSGPIAFRRLPTTTQSFVDARFPTRGVSCSAISSSLF